MYSEIKSWIDEMNKKNLMIPQSKWFSIDGYAVYMRHSRRELNGQINNKVITIATISMQKKTIGKGKFSRFLNFIESEYTENMIYIENVLSARFRKYFEKRDYIKDQFNENCYFKDLSDNQK